MTGVVFRFKLCSFHHLAWLFSREEKSSCDGEFLAARARSELRRLRAPIDSENK